VSPSDLGEIARVALRATRSARSRIELRLVVEGADRVVPLSLGPHVPHLPALARWAIRSAEHSAPELIATQLYCFNTAPLTPAWRARLGTRDDVERFCGIAAGSRARDALDAEWARASFGNDDRAWIGWSRRVRSDEDPSPARWKLYASPSIHAMPEVVPRVLAAATDHGASALKLGGSLDGLLRPDKLVVYFDAESSLRAAARQLSRELAGVAAQGVPFTAPIGAAGLLSWGVDPPGTVVTPEARSWRSWVTSTLARWLVTARSTTVPGLEPWVIALSGLAAEGVNVERWTPPASWTT
jgi:hypothetical protein